jgi:hypothetical protein
MEKRLKLPRLLVAATASALALSACSQGAQGPSATSNVNPGKASYATAQISVGTANVFGSGVPALNVVTTYRVNGSTVPAKSAVLVDTPTITGPFILPGVVAAAGSNGDPFTTISNPGGGPSAQEGAAGHILEGTSQNVRPTTPVCDAATAAECPGTNTTPNTTTFGESGGVFANGLQPANNTNNSVPYSYTPYLEPLWDNSTTNVTNDFVPWGGPPAYDPDGNGLGLRDGLNYLGNQVDGVGEGLTTFLGITPVAGTYNLSLQVPTGLSSSLVESYATITPAAPATLVSTAILPTITAPQLVPDAALDGGATLTFALPAGTTEAFVQIVDYGPADGGANCQGGIGPTSGAGPVYYTLLVNAASGANLTLPTTIGPNIAAAGKIAGSPSLCSAAANNTATAGAETGADTFTVQAIAADYPMYELNSLFGGEAPTIKGANGQSDITISLPSAVETYDVGTPPVASTSVARSIKARAFAKSKSGKL